MTMLILILRLSGNFNTSYIVLAFSHYETMFPGLPTFGKHGSGIMFLGLPTFEKTWLGNNVSWFVHLREHG
jgi:hypothetical protein